jgi:polyferredoxin
MKNVKFKHFIPLLIGITLGVALGWWGFLIIFPWIGGWITLGHLIAIKKKGKDKDIGRRISILMIAPVFLVFLGAMQRENLQIEETVFYTLLLISTGIFTRVLIHFTIAKILGPFIWGRGFCGWACWTAAILEWLPIKENHPIPVKYTRIRYLVFVVSLLIPIVFILLGYDWVTNHIQENGKIFQTGKPGALIWFLVGNGIYYLAAILLAFKFKKKRAFCKIACPVSLVMKVQTTIALVKTNPSGKECISCKTCNMNCPMDVDVMSYISAGKKVSSSECILCGICSNVCSQKAIL